MSPSAQASASIGAVAGVQYGLTLTDLQSWDDGVNVRSKALKDHGLA